MAPLALGLGLSPPDPEEAARIPRRAQVEDVLLERGVCRPITSMWARVVAPIIPGGPRVEQPVE